MKPYAEQTRTYDNGRGKYFTIRLFCQGTYDFTMKSYNDEPIFLITALDVQFVHDCIREMRGWDNIDSSEGTDLSTVDTN